jgi:hypothetical protein
MTPKTPHTETRTQNASPKIYLFVRPRRLLMAASLVLVVMAASAAALPGLPALPAVPGAPALPALPQAPALPALPAVSQQVDTPIGSTYVSADNGKIDVCTKDAASTEMLPAAPALPALPVAVPALPVDTGAGAAANVCAHANANDLTASASAGAAAYGAGQKAGLKADTDGKSGDVEAHTGFFGAIVHWFAGLF